MPSCRTSRTRSRRSRKRNDVFLSGRDYTFIKRQKYEETSPAELEALDELASLLAAERLEQLPELYRATPALRLEGAERDPHSVVFLSAQEGRGGAARPDPLLFAGS